MLQKNFKDAAVGKTQVYVWFNCFKRGEMSVKDQPCCDRPSMSRNNRNGEKVSQVALANRHWTNDKIS